ncbi:ribosome maturation protein RimP [Sphingosinicella sp.]|uniref:ribosome maturation protein RimP n=1 Tax=Sphingosinicella sp. TaxID=1917971 RepID=UPI004037C0E9
MAEIAELKRIIEPEVEAEGLALVRVTMIGGKDDPTIQIMAERPDTRQLTIDDCERLHRRIAERHEHLSDDYRLEVSSPGIDRPLTRLADYDDWKGHEARLTLSGEKGARRQYRGALLGAAGEDVLIDVPGRGETRLPFSGIDSAKLVLTDKLIAATRPLSTEGAEEIETLEELTEEQD